jgi:hypothetical protein
VTLFLVEVVRGQTLAADCLVVRDCGRLLGAVVGFGLTDVLERVDSPVADGANLSELAGTPCADADIAVGVAQAVGHGRVAHVVLLGLLALAGVTVASDRRVLARAV